MPHYGLSENRRDWPTQRLTDRAKHNTMPSSCRRFLSDVMMNHFSDVVTAQQALMKVYLLNPCLSRSDSSLSRGSDCTVISGVSNGSCKSRRRMRISDTIHILGHSENQASFDNIEALSIYLCLSSFYGYQSKNRCSDSPSKTYVVVTRPYLDVLTAKLAARSNKSNNSDG